MDSNRNDREGELEIPSSQIKSRSINTETNLTAVNDAKTHTLARMLRLQRCFEENMNVLYDFCSLYVSEWPLLTLEWIPALTISDPSCDYTLKYLAVGMQASKGKPNQVQLMEVALPSVQNTDDGGYSISSAGMRPATDPGNQFQHVRGHCCFQHVITVDSPVLKIRAGSINTHLVAVKAGSGFIGVYNLAQDENMCGREHALLKIVLRGHRSGGFGLAWNPVRAGIIASGGDDCYVNYWDIRHAIDCTTVDCEARELSVLPDATGSDAWPIGRFVGHRDVVTDVSWHASEDHLLVSSSLDGDVRFWDTRFNARPTTLIEAHKGGATAAQFHPTGVFQLVTAGVRGEVSFWDTRWPKEPFMTIHYHNQCVTGLQWSPFSKTILGSFSESGQVVIWDLDKSHLPPGYSENDMAPPEVAFVHIGHLGPVTDLSWCPEERDAWIMASADALNGIHVYRPKLSILRDYIVTL
ncbi:unnamed protein product [Phytomonas sp. EM1]|nr:unnamed protein product [Phytomonas sp. EM1]|eukprot:CCW61697.1 unnamed protein product [Phytomonas sp. isolate EM1]